MRSERSQVVRASNETYGAADAGAATEMSAAMAKALRNGNLWLTVAYLFALLLLAKANA
jgi:hypothetical protein